MSISLKTKGHGVDYLLRTVVRGDVDGGTKRGLAAYYAASGTPPGRFMGRGCAGLNDGWGVEVGAPVSEVHLRRMLEHSEDPITGQKLGRSPQVGKRAAVTSIDLTYSAPKSVSAAWAVGDEAVQQTIYEAHKKALAYVISYAEDHVFGSRSGKGGIISEDIRGVVAAVYDHWDSRSGDPQLHSHVVVMNRAQCLDGTWRTLDSRSLFKASVGMSEMYNTVLSDYLTADLGYGWDATARRHSPVPKYEVAGVGEALRAEFSQRSNDIEAAVDRLIQEYVSFYDRHPADAEVLKLREQATLETRPNKVARPLADMMADWRTRAQRILGEDPVAWVATLAGRNDLPPLRSADLGDAMLAEAAKVSLHVVADKRATFGRNNLFAEVERYFAGTRFLTPDERLEVVERTTTMATEDALLITPPELAHTPVLLQRADGTSRFRPRDYAVYTTQPLLDAERRLQAAGRTLGAPTVSPLIADIVCKRPLPGRTHALSDDQFAAVKEVVTSGRVVDVLVGAAGTGKTAAMATATAAWKEEHGPGSVVGLAPSAAAAEVLQIMVGAGITAENTAKWLHESSDERQGRRRGRLDELRAALLYASPSLSTTRRQAAADTLEADIARWSLHPGQLLIIDEASMAGTFELDDLRQQVVDAGAKLLLVGDWAQLSSVNAGGAFHMLAKDRDNVATLHGVHRFVQEWERGASLDLRHGRPEAADRYIAAGVVEGGDRDPMLDDLYAGWAADVRAGKRSLMLAGDKETVQALNDRARADRVVTGEVSPDGITTISGSIVGQGDVVVTRRNVRGLTTGKGWVKNGDVWTVLGVNDDGTVEVQRAGGTGRTTLPAAYATQHLQLGYATTAHQSQGRTVDTSHSFITLSTMREVLYVMATRGMECNRLYVERTHDPDQDTSHEEPEVMETDEVLRYVLAHPGADKSATLTIADEWGTAHSIGRLHAEYEAVARLATEDRHSDLVRNSGLDRDQVDAVKSSQGWGPLLAAFRSAEAHGYDLAEELPGLVQDRSLDGVDDIAAILQGRVHKMMELRRSYQEPDLIAGLFPAAVGVTDPDMVEGLEDRRRLIEERVRAATLEAIQNGDGWTRRYGTMPTDEDLVEEWLQQLDGISAERGRWGKQAYATPVSEPAHVYGPAEDEASRGHEL